MAHTVHKLSCHPLGDGRSQAWNPSGHTPIKERFKLHKTKGRGDNECTIDLTGLSSGESIADAKGCNNSGLTSISAEVVE
jgi:hypothetical protein